METETNDINFKKEVIENSEKISVLVDFWAPWCSPCLMLKPILEKIANSKEYKDKFMLAKLNVEENKETASKYKIMSIPNVKLFKNGKIVDEFIGIKSEEEIKEFLERNL